ncbi:UNVERIFIED_CONTAM: hypothetical protein HDU68_012854 [Siphonaria sp. JEL0065]|nr:hypothetical protein HDU68_012854 [Siphonaria sp. JEL0065]
MLSNQTQPFDEVHNGIDDLSENTSEKVDLSDLVTRFSSGSLQLSQLLREASKVNYDPLTGPVVVLATVLGDHYDMGKSIIASVLKAKGCKVIDLGISIGPNQIVTTALIHNADVIGLSGLIVPSLDQMILVVKELEKRGLKIPVLIGGAATTRKNTATRIAPHYSGPVIHVMDASRSLLVVSQLTTTKRSEFLQEVSQEYSDILQDHLEDLESPMKCISLSEARLRKFQINWKEWTPRVPAFLGSKKYAHIPLSYLVKNIHWDPFFQIMHLRGTYPNHSYPNILKDNNVGAESARVLEEVKRVLKEIIDANLLEARAVVWFGKASAIDDDIHIYSGESDEEVGVFYGLRQQHVKEDDHHFCISDFIAPLETGVTDYVGGMVVSAGFGLLELCERVKGDDYKILMYKAAAECLTGALAECVHDQVKHVFWNKERKSDLVVGDLLDITVGTDLAKDGRANFGIRLAPCFPQQPDHTEMETMWRLMDVEKLTGIQLTETLGMAPVMAINGILFSHPESQCFAVGDVMPDQVQDYATRRGVSVDIVEKWLSLNR